MATRIIEYGGVAVAGTDFPIVPSANKIKSQPAMTASGVSAKGAAFQDTTIIVCIQSDEAVYVAFGADPTATTDDYRIPAGSEQFFSVKKNWTVAIRT